MIVGLFATLIVTSSDAPGTALELQFFATCQVVPSPRPVQETWAISRRCSSTSMAGWWRRLALRQTNSARAVFSFTRSIRGNLNRVMAAILFGRSHQSMVKTAVGDACRRRRPMVVQLPQENDHPAGDDPTRPVIGRRKSKKT